MKKMLLLFMAVVGVFTHAYTQSGQKSFGRGDLEWSYNSSTSTFTYELTVYPPAFYTPDSSDNGGDNSSYVLAYDVTTGALIGGVETFYTASNFPNGTTVYSGQISLAGYNINEIDIYAGAFFIDENNQISGGSDVFVIE